MRPVASESWGAVVRSIFFYQAPRTPSYAAVVAMNDPQMACLSGWSENATGLSPRVHSKDKVAMKLLSNSSIDWVQNFATSATRSSEFP